MIVSHLSDEWTLYVNGDGSAELQYGAGMLDNVVAPAGSIPVGKFAEDCDNAAKAAALVPDAVVSDPDKGQTFMSHPEFAIGRQDSVDDPGKGSVAVFTPEMKSYCDLMLERKLSDRVQMLTNRFPVLSKRLMKSLNIWTNSPEYKAWLAAKSVTSAVNVPTGAAAVAAAVTVPVVATPEELSPSPSAKGQPAMQPVISEPAASESKDSMGFRGWLVIGLLAIGAFLTYRFIRLRLGS